MAYLKSTQVKVYPSAYRGVNDKGELFNPEAQLNTEFNITNLQAPSPNRSYVITAYRGANTPLRCVIRGYYFELTLDDTTLAQFEKSTEVSSVYASIVVKAANNVDDTNTNYAAYTLVPYTQTTIGVPTSSLDEKQGDDYVFTGLMLTNEPPTDATDYLLILQKQVGDDSWRVPSTSRGRFYSHQILDSVKGETIDDSFTTKNLEVKENATIVGALEVDDSTTLKDTLTVAGPTSLEASLELKQGGIISKGDIRTTFGNVISENDIVASKKVTSPNIETKNITATDNNGTIGSETTPFKNIYVNTLVASTINGKFVGNLDVTRVESSEVGPNLTGQYVAYVELSFNTQGNNYKISVSGLVDLQSGSTTIPVNCLLSHTEETDNTDKQTNATRCTDIRAEGYIRIFQRQSQFPYGVKCEYILYIYEYKDVRHDTDTSPTSTQYIWLVQRTLKKTLTGSATVHYIHIQG